MTVPVEAPTLLADIFPAEVVFPGGIIERRCRVFIYDDGLVVFQEKGHGNVKIFGERHREEPDLPSRNTPRLRWRATVRTVKGDVFVNRSGGCGCHSTLIRMRPEDARV